MKLKEKINDFLREYKRGILISWIILGFYILINRFVKMQIYAVFDWQSFNHLYWIVPLVYLLLGIILRLAYPNSFDQEFLDKLLKTPVIGWIIPIFQ